MDAYLFTGWISQFRLYRTSDSCLSLILCSDDAEQARARFEAWLLSGNQAPEPIPTKVERIVSAPVLGQMFTETEVVTIDWATMPNEVETALEADTTDVMEQGYWVDCNALVRPGSLSVDLEALRRDLPEDVGSGLNWSADQQHFYLVSALTPPRPQLEIGDDTEALESGGLLEGEGQPDGPDQEAPGMLTYREREAAFPALAAREAVVLVRARNSVVAAWLWRKHASSTPLARNTIRLDPWCGAVVLDGTEATPPGHS